MLKRLFSKQNRALLSELVRTDFKLRYQDSVLGYGWTLLRPLLLFVILYVVFVKFLKIGNDVPHYPVYLLLGIVVWNFFLELTMQGLGSIVGRGGLIQKIGIPRWIIVVSSSFSALISFSLNLVVIFIFMLLNGINFSFSMIWLLPVFLEIYLFALGMSFLLATAFVKFRDVSYIWEVVLQAGFYATPILYPLSRITNLTIQKLMLLNPIAQALQNARYIAVTKQAVIIQNVFKGGWYQYIPYGIVVLTLALGVIYFRKESKNFAEQI